MTRVKIKFAQYLNIPARIKSNPLKDYWGKDAVDHPPSYLSEGILKNDWIEKFESEVPSALIFVWDFNDKIFEDALREYMEIY